MSIYQYCDVILVAYFLKLFYQQTSLIHDLLMNVAEDLP